MEIRYSRDVDILPVRFSDQPADYAEETEGLIAHFSADGKPVSLEIQGGKEFLLRSIASLVEDRKVTIS